MTGCLIIHGYTGGPHEVEPVRQYLAERTDWIIRVPVLTGHGKELHLEEATHEIWLQEAEEELKQLLQQCEKVFVIGFSMGGMIAAYLAANYPVDKLVLLSTARKYLSFKYLRHYIKQMIDDGFKGKLLENKMFIHYKDKISNVPFKANLEFMKLVHKTKQYLKDIHTPVLIAQGQKDGIVPFQAAYSLEEEIASDEKEVVIFEQSNHLICLGEDRNFLNEMIYTFLTEDETENTKAKEQV